MSFESLLVCLLNEFYKRIVVDDETFDTLLSPENHCHHHLILLSTSFSKVVFYCKLEKFFFSFFIYLFEKTVVCPHKDKLFQLIFEVGGNDCICRGFSNIYFVFFFFFLLSYLKYSSIVFQTIEICCNCCATKKKCKKSHLN